MEGCGETGVPDLIRMGSPRGGGGMNAARVILVTVAGPAGQMDIGVRSDATPSELAASLGSMLGVSLTRSLAEHRSPPRPGSRQGQRAMLNPGTSLAAAGVADGDLVVFRRTDDGLGRAPAPPHGVLRNPVPAAAQPGLPRGTRPSQAGAPGTVPPPRPDPAAQAAPLPRADPPPPGARRSQAAQARRPAASPHAASPPYAGPPPYAQPPAAHAPAISPAVPPSWLGSSGTTPAPQPDPRDSAPRPALPRHARASDPAAVPGEETRPHDRH